MADRAQLDHRALGGGSDLLHSERAVLGVLPLDLGQRVLDRLEHERPPRRQRPGC
jgi:hypothetical protein